MALFGGLRGRGQAKLSANEPLAIFPHPPYCCSMLPALTPFDDMAMRAACAEARRWLGATTPNPAVGAAALDENGTLLAVAAHRRAGTDHAEVALLKLCHEQNILARVHTMCVTLEPCNHTGRTPPCSEAIINAGIRRVVVGVSDPNTHVKGGGIAHLRAAGIEVVEGAATDLCRAVIHPFAHHARTGKPFVTVKRAFTIEGSMIPPVGQKTFTAPESLKLAHRLRKKADAIVTGSGTILADTPLFTVRHVEDFADKKRILAILDQRRRVPTAYLAQMTGLGFEPIVFDDLDSCLLTLEKRGIRDVLVESGPILSQSVLDSPLWCLRVDINRGTPDTVHATLQPGVDFGFDINKIRLEALLPL